MEEITKRVATQLWVTDQYFITTFDVDYEEEEGDEISLEQTLRLVDYLDERNEDLFTMLAFMLSVAGSDDSSYQEAVGIAGGCQHCLLKDLQTLKIVESIVRGQPEEMAINSIVQVLHAFDPDKDWGTLKEILERMSWDSFSVLETIGKYIEVYPNYEG
jgi:hypothetical protein